MKKKLYTFTLAGCLFALFSSSAFAAPSDNKQNITTPYTSASSTMCWQDDAIFSSQGRQKVLSYSEQFQKNYPWMYAGTRHSAANSFVIIDQAEKDNKISIKQANSLKKELIAFYKKQQQDEDTWQKSNHHDTDEYRHSHHRHFSLKRNLYKIAQKLIFH